MEKELSIADIKQILAETAFMQKESVAMQEKAYARQEELYARQKSSQEEVIAMQKEVIVMQKESVAMQKEAIAMQKAAKEEIYAMEKDSYARRSAKHDKEIEEIKAMQRENARIIGGMGRNNGAFAENLFLHSLEKSKTFAGVHFDTVSNKFRRLKKMPNGTKLEDQFDIVMTNDDAVAIIEVKYKAESNDAKEMIEKKIPNFKSLFSDYADYKVYLGLGALSFDDYAVKEAEKLGIGLLKVAGDAVEYKTDWVRAY